MKEKIQHYFKEIVIVTVLLAITMNLLSYYRSMDLNKALLPLKEVTLLDGTSYTLKSNKPIVLHFWATWCPICKLEASNIEKLSKDYEVITIAVQSGNAEEIASYLQENQLSFKVVNDTNGALSRQFNIQAFPTTFIYDSKQQLVFSEVGYTSTLGLYLRMLFTS